jgi:SAM-dependent methyltransferase
MTATTALDCTGTEDDRTFHHRTRGRFNAWFFTTFDRYINFISREHKADSFAGIRRGDVVELGPGVGANFSYVPPGSRLLAVEPNGAMHAELAGRAAARGIHLELIDAPAEALPLPDSSVDEVICSLVLCTVEDPSAAIAEVLRVLRPGGTFRFVEHVASHAASPRRWIQAAIAKPWSWIFEGCRLCRDTAHLIEQAGFSRTEITRHRFNQSVFFPVNLAISGRAIK